MREVAPGLAVGLARLRVRETLERQAHVLEERVAERTRELEDVNVELERFAYTVSHDLRAPLRAMEGLSDALLEDVGEALGPDGTEYARRIRAAAQRMDLLIHDLLAYSRITTSRLEVEPLDLDLVVADALGLVAGPIAAADADIRVERGLGVVLGQQTMVAQAIANLVGNAVKFARPGVRPVVALRTEPRGAALRLWVEDNGIGIEPRHAERIFGVFERLHGAEAYPGTGIGLAIVAKAVERLGGRTGVELGTPTGSRFWLELPRAEPEA
ncbi:MAG: ATP-binding protein [Thermoleophilia bacterium]